MNRITQIVLFAAYVVASVSGLAILRHFLPQIALPLNRNSIPSTEARLWLLLGGGLYIFSFALWLLILRATPLVIAYPAAVGLTICGTTAISLVLLGERLHLSQGAGIGLVLLGIVLIFRGS
jgi:multidrug transporter EmrE-like cation transporter